MKKYYPKTESGIEAVTMSDADYESVATKLSFLPENSKEVRDYLAETKAKVDAANLTIANKQSALAKIAKVAGLTDEELAALA